jgi:predicted amidohydrolase
MSCGTDSDDNVARAEALVRRAAADGARLIALPELFASLASGRVMRELAEPLDGSTTSWAAALSAELGCWLLAGSFVERDGGGQFFNTSCLFDPSGSRVATYRKVHLFDVDVPGAGIHESELFSAGDGIVVVPVDDHSLGMSVCYDLRFPELYRIATLRGATIVVIPSAFTAATGPHHWEPLIRARAIENQVFVVAPGQCGSSPDGVARHGHSLIVDPWGRVMAEADSNAETVIAAECDLDELRSIRTAIPSLANRRPEAYDWPA